MSPPDAIFELKMHKNVFVVFPDPTGELKFLPKPPSGMEGCLGWSRPSIPLTLPLGWAGCYTCPALRPYQFGPMRNPDVTRRSQ